MIWNWEWKKMLLSISCKYSYFKPIFNYIRKGLSKRTLICWNYDTLMCFHPNLTFDILHLVSGFWKISLSVEKSLTLDFFWIFGNCWLRAFYCHNLSLGFVPKQRLTKVWAKNEPRNHISCSRSAKKCEGMNPHTPKWTPTLGIGIPMGSEFLEGDCRGQNSLNWKVIYIIEKLLKRKCLKWACMTNLGS
jgi:hypothetical protein